MQSQQVSAKTYVLIGVVSVFALLGLLIAYNSGATAEEAQAASVARRVESVRRRLLQCHVDVETAEKGQRMSFEQRRHSLQLQLAALEEENKLYSEQNAALESANEACGIELKVQRRHRTGSSEVDVADDILRLRYQIKNVEDAIESANETRASERQNILRLIEAYAKENKQLLAEQRRQAIDEARKLNLTLST